MNLVLLYVSAGAGVRAFTGGTVTGMSGIARVIAPLLKTHFELRFGRAGESIRRLPPPGRTASKCRLGLGLCALPKAHPLDFAPTHWARFKENRPFFPPS